MNWLLAAGVLALSAYLLVGCANCQGGKTVCSGPYLEVPWLP